MSQPVSPPANQSRTPLFSLRSSAQIADGLPLCARCPQFAPRTSIWNRLLQPFALLSMLGLLLGTTGCAQPGRLDISSAPDDFMLGLTVFEPPTPIPGQRTRDDLPRALKPSRYVIESDGILRAALGNAATPGVFPAQTRRLSPQQFDAIWILTRQTGVFEGAGEPVGAVSSYQPPRGQIMALIEAFAAGQRGYAAFSLHEDQLQDDQTDATGARALSDALAELAWIPEQPVDVGSELRAREAFSDPRGSSSTTPTNPAPTSAAQPVPDPSTRSQSTPPARPAQVPITSGTGTPSIGTTGTGTMTPVRDP